MTRVMIREEVRKAFSSTSERSKHNTTTMAEKKSQIPDNPSSAKKTATEIGSGSSYSGQRTSYYNRPESVNPDQATLREQWKFAIRQYSKWYSHAWGTAILAGGVFFGLGWIIKGSNPLPSLQSSSKLPPPPPPSGRDEEK